MPLRDEDVRVVRRTLADGSTREYRYPKRRPPAQRFDPNSVCALVSAYRQSPEWRALKKSTQRNYGYYLRDIEAMGNLPVKAIRRRDLMHARDTIAATRGNGAANLFTKMIKVLLAWGCDREWIEHSPASRIKALPIGHFLAWTAEEADFAAANLPSHFARVVILARYTGQRRGDLAAMTWRSYDGKTIKVKQEKTGTEMVVPVHPDLKAELDEWKLRTESTHILTSETGIPWSLNHLTELFGRAVQKLGLRRTLNLHGLRKLAAASLAEAGCSIHEIAAITGHKSLAMVQLYTASAQQERLAATAMGRMGPRGAIVVRLPKQS